MSGIVLSLAAGVLAQLFLVKHKTDLEREQWPELEGPVRALVGTFALVKFVISGKRTVVTSLITDPVADHNPQGKHPKKRAADLRSNDMTESEKRVVLNVVAPVVQLAGGVLILEDHGGPNEHFHLQV